MIMEILDINNTIVMINTWGLGGEPQCGLASVSERSIALGHRSTGARGRSYCPQTLPAATTNTEKCDLTMKTMPWMRDSSTSHWGCTAGAGALYWARGVY